MDRKTHTENCFIPIVGRNNKFLNPNNLKQYVADSTAYKDYPNLRKYYGSYEEDGIVSNLHLASGDDMWLLSQMAHPNEHGFKVGRSSVLHEWEKPGRGHELFKSLGFPTNPQSIWKNRYSGNLSLFKPSYTFKGIDDRSSFWSKAEHALPLLNYSAEKTFLEEKIKVLKNNLLLVKKSNKETIQSISWDIHTCERDMQLLTEALKNNDYELPREPIQTNTNLFIFDLLWL